MQIRAGRGLLGMSQAALAERAGVGISTLQRLESSSDILKTTGKTLVRLQQALEAEGVVFIDQNDEEGPGVRLKKPLP